MDEKKLREIINASPFGFAHHEIIVDGRNRPVDYRFLEVNPAFERLAGISAKNVIGKTVREVIPGIEKVDFDWIGFYGKVALGGGSESFEQFSEPLNRWYQVSVYSTQKGFFTTSFVDISEQNKQKDELQSFFSVNPDLLCIVDMDGSFVKTNDAWYTILGYTPEELNTRKVLDFIHPDDMQAALDAMANLGKGDDVLNLTNRYRCKNGSYRYLEWHSHSRGDLIYAVARDVTDQKKAEEALKAERDLFSEGPVFTIIWDPSEAWPVKYVSDNIFDILGYSPEQMMSKDFRYAGLIHPGDVQRIADEVTHFISNNIDLFEQSYRLKHRDGQYLWFYDFTKLIRNSENKVAEMHGYMFEQTNLKNAQLEIELQKHRLSSVIEGTNVGTWEWNVQTGETVFNERWAEIIGYTLDELMPLSIETWMQYAHPEDLKTSGEKLQKHFNGTAEFYDIECRMKHKAGHWIWVQDRGRVASWTDDGKPEWMYGTHSDITERKQAEERLRQRTAELEDIRQTLADQGELLAEAMLIGAMGAWFFEVATGMFTFTDAFYAVFRTTAAAEGGHLMSPARYAERFIPPAYREVVATEVGAALTSGEQDYRRTLDHQVIFADGSPGWIQVSFRLVRDADGNPLRIIGVNQDITARKAAEAVQADTALRLSLATKAGGVGVWDWDCVGNVLVWDEQMYALYGISKETFSGAYESWRNGLHPDDSERGDREITAALKGEKEFDTEFRVVWPDGSIHHIRALAKVQRDRDGKPLRMIGTNWDISAQKHAEQELKEINGYLEKQTAIANDMAAQAQMASAAKSEFLANMSHEIRTPLNGVIGFSDLLKNTPLNAVQQQYVNNVNVSGHALLGIINDILDFSKIEAGMLELEIVKTDMVELLESSADIVQFAAGKKGLEILLDIDQDMPRFAHVDPVRLKQILANLMGNAIKFTEQGEVELKVGFQMLDDGQGKLAFSVRDTGIGISDAQQEKLFKAFSQADNSTTRKFGGTGLGLIISDMIAGKMGSKINISSVPGVGTTFFFDITTAVEAGEKLDTTQIAQIKRCLIIDDNANNCLILKHMLQQWQITCESCDNGLEALERLEISQQFDVIICDYNMPYMDGLETIRMIREKLKLGSEEQPVILLYSSSENAELHQKCADMGVRLRLSKPVKSNDLFGYLCNLHQAEPEIIEQAEPEQVSDSHRTDSTGEKLRILVAEDVPMNMMLINAILPELVRDVEVFEVENGQQAVERYKRITPDLVLMDVQMPVLDGLEATRQIRAIEADTGSHVPIIALTAGALREEMEKCFAAGMDDFLTKPIEPEKTKTILDKYLTCRKKDPGVSPDADTDDEVHFGYNELAPNFGSAAEKDIFTKTEQLDRACREMDAQKRNVIVRTLKGAYSSVRFKLMSYVRYCRKSEK